MVKEVKDEGWQRMAGGKRVRRKSAPPKYSINNGVHGKENN